jgi:hypothetical protein
VACEAFDNFPPGQAAKALARVIRRSPHAYGGMSVRGIPDEVLAPRFGHGDRIYRLNRGNLPE